MEGENLFLKGVPALAGADGKLIVKLEEANIAELLETGGQNAMGGLLFHPEFFKVGLVAGGCHDNRMAKASWNEQGVGYPVGPH